MFNPERLTNREEDMEEETPEEEPQEIERKFLVESLPEDIEQYPNEDIVQGYLAIMEDGTEIRLRNKGDKYFQTVKSGRGKTRMELEIEITQEQYELFWVMTEVKRVEKKRYQIPHEKGIIELDVYGGDLDGLLSVEIEFKDQDASEDFKAPEWFGREVTEDPNYKNQSLALNGIPKQETINK